MDKNRLSIFDPTLVIVDRVHEGLAGPLLQAEGKLMQVYMMQKFFPA